MSLIEALLLGLLQGFAEFLPVSSSGHLVVAQRLFGLEDVPLLFTVFLHLATLCAVVLFFRKQIADLFLVLFRWIFHKPISSTSCETGLPSTEIALATEKGKRQMIIALILATFVTGIIGLSIRKILPALPIQFVFAGFLFTAITLIFASRITAKTDAKNTVSTVTPKQGLIIGLAQGVGVFPGISRSGITISSGMVCGVDRNTAGEFSFLLSIPAILGAFILELKDLGEVVSNIGILPVIVGCVAAFVSGFIALSWLMKLIRKGKLEYFAFYLVPFGVVGLLLL